MNNFPKNIVIFSTADWDTKPWTNKQHVARHFAAKGFRVLYIESTGIRRPTCDSRDFLRMVRRIFKGVRSVNKVENRIFVLSPLIVPLARFPLFRKFNRLLMKFLLRFWLKRLSFNKYFCLTYNPFSYEFIEDLNAEWTVYHCVDDLSVIPNSDKSQVEHADNELVSRVQILFVSSPGLYDKWQSKAPNKIYFLPNVSDYKHFSKAKKAGAIPPDLKKIPCPRICYIGTLSDYKIDFELIERVAISRKKWNWVFIGDEREGQDSQSLKRLKYMRNVYFLGYREYERLPYYLRGLDISVLPLKKNQYTDHMFPMKFFEYLAAGKPVMATAIRAIEPYQKAFFPINSAEGFIDNAEKLLGGVRPDPEYCDALAKKYTWDWRLNEMLALMDSHCKRIALI